MKTQMTRHLQPRALSASQLYLVTQAELDGLTTELARENVPTDLESKLNKLAVGNLRHRFVEQNCRTIIALLSAAKEGSFRGLSRNDSERLLRVLAYVRKD